MDRGRSAGAAFAGLALLIGSWACDDASPQAKMAAPTRSAVATASVTPTVNTAAKLDAAPAATPPEKRLRQRRVGNQLVIDSKAKWDRDCLIHRACKVTPTTLERCAPGSDAPLWSTLPGKAEHFTDPRVSIKGQLVLEAGWFSCGYRPRVNTYIGAP